MFPDRIASNTGWRFHVQNSYNLPKDQFEKIQGLTAEQLKAARKKLNSQTQDDEQMKEEIARNVAGGGDFNSLVQGDEARGAGQDRGVNR